MIKCRAHQVVDYALNGLHPFQEVPHFVLCRLTVHLPLNLLHQLFRQLVLHGMMQNDNRQWYQQQGSAVYVGMVYSLHCHHH